jgi:hypothetical protein
MKKTPNTPRGRRPLPPEKRKRKVVIWITAETARRLGMHRRTLARKMDKRQVS